MYYIRTATKAVQEPILRYTLLIKIMGSQPGHGHKNGTYQNPMRDKDPHTLLIYFNGERTISPRDASTIYSSIKLEKFEKYIGRRCSSDAAMHLLDDLLVKVEDGEIPKNTELPQICAQLFEKILRNLAAA